MSVKARCNSAEMLEFVEEPFNEVARLVERFGKRRRVFTMISSGRILAKRALLCKARAQRIGNIRAVGQQHDIGPERIEHIFSALSIMGLPLGQFQRDRQTVGVDECVTFAATAARSHATRRQTGHSVPFQPPRLEVGSTVRAKRKSRL